jgi:hypothetical protein
MKQSQQQKVIVNIGKPEVKRRRRKPVQKKPSPPVLPNTMRVINASGVFQPTANLAENIAQILRPTISSITQNTRPKTILEEKRVEDFYDLKRDVPSGVEKNKQFMKDVKSATIESKKEQMKQNHLALLKKYDLGQPHLDIMRRYNIGIFAPTEDLPITSGGGRRVISDDFLPEKKIFKEDINEGDD